jgi:hypothetical protein
MLAAWISAAPDRSVGPLRQSPQITPEGVIRCHPDIPNTGVVPGYLCV